MKKLLCGFLAVAVLSSASISVLAAGTASYPLEDQNVVGDATQEGTVIINGEVGPWDNNPDNPDVNPPVTPPTMNNLSVSIPVNMYFKLVTNGKEPNTYQFVSADYAVKNNSTKPIEVMIKNVTPHLDNNIQLVSTEKAKSTMIDDKFDLSISLKGMSTQPVEVVDNATNLVLEEIGLSETKIGTFIMNGYDQSKDNDGYKKVAKWDISFEFSLKNS